MDEDGIEIDRAILRALLKGLKKKNVRFYRDQFGLLTKLVRSRWLDIGQNLFFTCLWTETDQR